MVRVILKISILQIRKKESSTLKEWVLPPSKLPLAMFRALNSISLLVLDSSIHTIVEIDSQKTGKSHNPEKTKGNRGKFANERKQ